MVRVKKSFCGFSLTAVGTTVAMLGIILSILYFMYMIFAVGNVATFCVTSGSCPMKVKNPNEQIFKEVTPTSATTEETSTIFSTEEASTENLNETSSSTTTEGTTSTTMGISALNENVEAFKSIAAESLKAEEETPEVTTEKAPKGKKGKSKVTVNIEDVDLQKARVMVWILFFKSVLILGIHIALEVGISKNKPKLIFAYIILGTIIFLLSLITFIANAESFRTMLLQLFIILPIFGYVMIILYSLKCDMEDAKKGERLPSKEDEGV